MKPFSASWLGGLPAPLGALTELALFPGLITLTLGFPRPRLSQRGREFNICFFTSSGKKKKCLRLWKRRAQAFRLKRPDFRLQVLALLPLAYSETSALLVRLAEPQRTQQSNGNDTDLTDLIRVKYIHPLPSFPSGNT